MSLEAFEWQKITSGGNIGRPRLYVARRMETESFCMFRPTEGLKIEIRFERRRHTCLSGPPNWSPNRGLALSGTVIIELPSKYLSPVCDVFGWMGIRL